MRIVSKMVRYTDGERQQAKSALVGVRPLTGQALAWAVVGAGLAQFLWLTASCMRAGMKLSLPLPLLTPEERRLLKIMGPGVFGSGVSQMNLRGSTAMYRRLPTVL